MNLWKRSGSPVPVQVPAMTPLFAAAVVPSKPTPDLRDKVWSSHVDLYDPIRSHTAVADEQADYIELNHVFTRCNHCHQSTFTTKFKEFNRCPNPDCGL